MDDATKGYESDKNQDIQPSEMEGAAERVTAIVEASYRQFKRQPLVCLACTELPSAFPEWKTFAFFESGDIVYVNSAILHANAAFNFAVE